MIFFMMKSTQFTNFWLLLPNAILSLLSRKFLILKVLSRKSIVLHSLVICMSLISSSPQSLHFSCALCPDQKLRWIISQIALIVCGLCILFCIFLHISPHATSVPRYTSHLPSHSLLTCFSDRIRIYSSLKLMSEISLDWFPLFKMKALFSFPVKDIWVNACLIFLSMVFDLG